MSFELKVQKYIKEQQLIDKGDRLLIACSGGVDSMGLVHFFKNFKQNLEIELFVAHVDHMLRGETSREDRQFVEDFCHQHDIPVFSTSIPIPKLLQEEGGNSQALCRRERYGYFKELMEEYQIQKLVTAHHADDQLESILMALTKAGTLSGMKGMYTKRDFSIGSIIRPFLSVTKEEIREYLEENGGGYREDASNDKDDYTRNRFRHHVVPLLKKENNFVSSHAVQFAQTLQQDDDFLKTLAWERFPHIARQNGSRSFTVKIPLLQKEPVALQRRIILILLNYLYQSNNNESYRMISSILNLCSTVHGSATLHLPEQIIAKRFYEEIEFTEDRKTIHPSIGLQQVCLDGWTQLQNGLRLYIGEASNVVHAQEHHTKKFYFNSQCIPAPFFIRARRKGDRISLKGMDQPKRVSRLFIDEKIPLELRANWPLLVDGKDEVVAVLGLRVSNKLSTHQQDGDDSILLFSSKNSYDSSLN
ncbi:tRNA lysidine(34) synthetase TilS [Lysinibacillus yapensis]|uniref:tRNA(Ile)-lysidine synthase n=1 Tax=Ureibacillus yapensis TaxID=2304605 RepID=A0A396S402_9BACL|nr:tRNA lysidine(34) synthetase TilS [Lysinibacillus yapensis]RHW31732.1 tRNA lysidine(34) synthetase TilS [Lysinibacillus yapensis]